MTRPSSSFPDDDSVCRDFRVEYPDVAVVFMAVDARVFQRRVFVAAELQDGVVHLRVVENADGEKQLEVIDVQTRDALEQLRLSA